MFLLVFYCCKTFKWSFFCFIFSRFNAKFTTLFPTLSTRQWQKNTCTTIIYTKVNDLLFWLTESLNGTWLHLQWNIPTVDVLYDFLICIIPMVASLEACWIKATLVFTWVLLYCSLFHYNITQKMTIRQTIIYGLIDRDWHSL